MKQSMLPIAALCILAMLHSSPRASCISDTNVLPIAQESNSWCWASCIAWLAQTYTGNSEFTKEFIVGDVCMNFCDPNGCWTTDPAISWGDCSWCRYTTPVSSNPCRAHYYTLTEIFQYMALELYLFTSPNEGDAQTRSLESFEVQMCSGGPKSYFVAGLGPDNNNGHLVVIVKMNIWGTIYPTITFMDPENPDDFRTIPAYSFYQGNGQNEYGPWKKYIGVYDYLGQSVGLEDIVSFSASSDGTDVDLSFEIQPSPEGPGLAAVYVSDGVGPARRVDNLMDYVDRGAVANWEDDMRPAFNVYYYYYLAYDMGMPDVCDESEVYMASGLPAQIQGPARSVLDAPEITSIVDMPYDQGTTQTINWQLSDDDSEIDYYNIFRSTYPADKPWLSQYHWLASTPAGQSTYVDHGADDENVNSYKVTAAHHDGVTLQPGDGNEGIWNEPSQAVIGSPVDNFRIFQVTLLSNDTILVAPSGSEDSVVVELMIWDSLLQPTVNIPPEMLYMLVDSDSGYYCAGDTVFADDPTDATGTTTFTIRFAGGHGPVQLVTGLVNSFLSFGTVDVVFRSPDGNSDGLVDLIDWAIISLCWLSVCGDANYVAKWDLNWDCAIDIIDLAIFSANFPSGCP